MAKEAVIRKKVVDYLEKDNWYCWYPAKVKFKDNDIFGVWDVLAFKKGRLVRFIQLTSVSNISARKKKVNAFLDKSGVEVWSEVWGYDQKKKRFVIHRQSAFGDLPEKEEIYL